ncbi:hypothetical protein [Streptomyces longwoodensis]|uniref:hypothetical protein n=1 Tax=Streptomyces longwoodensis TaxID=68231 RepID=UPI0036F57F74
MAYRLLIDNPRHREMTSAAARYTQLTGAPAYLYASSPGEGEPVRYVFTRRVCLGLSEALNYARLLRTDAERQHREAAQAAEHQRTIENMKDIT